jgi:hypothetical protein
VSLDVLLWLRRSWKLERMARIACAVALLGMFGVGCADNPYIIGHAADFADAGTDAAARCEDALVCSGFERADVAADWSDTVIEEAGELERSTTRVHSGEGSLHATSRAMQSVAVVVARFSPVRSGTLYFRAYLYVPSGLPTETMNVLFIGSRPDPDPDQNPFVGLDLNIVDGVLQSYSPQAEPKRQTGTAMITRDRWFCLRAEIGIGSHAEVALFVDDGLALRATGVNSLADSGVSMMRAGVDWSSSQDAFFELYLDDVVLDTRRVTCLGD